MFEMKHAMTKEERLWDLLIGTPTRMMLFGLALITLGTSSFSLFPTSVLGPLGLYMVVIGGVAFMLGAFAILVRALRDET